MICGRSLQQNLKKENKGSREEEEEATMPVTLHTSSLRLQDAVAANPLPTLLQTPSGLALLELQGTINLPEHSNEEAITPIDSNGVDAAQATPIGRLVFPDYDPHNPTSVAWMKRVYMYVGKHQRLTGQAKKLPTAIAVIRKMADGSLSQKSGEHMEGVEEEHADLEVVEIVKYKIIFSTRPEPVGTLAAEE